MKIIGLEKAIRTVSSIQKQVKFATALALNDTAKDVQSFTVGELLPAKFTLRSRGAPWWRGGKYGFNIKRATKQNQTAVIGSQADWLPDQEKGGTRKTPSGHRMPIPTERWKPRKAVMLRSKKPGRILRSSGVPAGLNAKPFVLGSGVYARMSRDRGPLVRLFTLKPSTRITARLAYGPSGMARARQVYPQHYARRLAYAIATAK